MMFKIPTRSCVVILLVVVPVVAVTGLWWLRQPAAQAFSAAGSQMGE